MSVKFRIYMTLWNNNSTLGPVHCSCALSLSLFLSVSRMLESRKCRRSERNGLPAKLHPETGVGQRADARRPILERSRSQPSEQEGPFATSGSDGHPPLFFSPRSHGSRAGTLWESRGAYVEFFPEGRQSPKTFSWCRWFKLQFLPVLLLMLVGATYWVRSDWLRPLQAPKAALAFRFFV